MSARRGLNSGWVAGATVLLWLGGCDRAPDPGETGKPVPAAVRAAPPPTSILRPDAAPAPRPAPLAPLAVRIGFDHGGATLDPAAIAALERIRASRQFAAGGPITLGGHSDSEGSDRANLRLSQQRAEAVRSWLVDHGADPERIAITAFGDQNPARPNARSDGTPDPAARAFNRRVEVRIELPPALAPTPEETRSAPTLVERVAGEE